MTWESAGTILGVLVGFATLNGLTLIPFVRMLLALQKDRDAAIARIDAVEKTCERQDKEIQRHRDKLHTLANELYVVGARQELGEKWRGAE